MNQATLEAYLGRSLTSIEATNLTLYLKIARQNLGDLLCMDLCSNDDPRTFDTRAGYKTIFVDIFTEITEVKLNGTVTTDYSVRQWDRRSGGWYNSLVFDEAFVADDEVQISASWGFAEMPSDLNMVLANLFGLITKRNKFDGSIERKRVEDFEIVFNTDSDIDDEFYQKFSKTLSKYSNCEIANIQSGATGSDCDFC